MRSTILHYLQPLNCGVPSHSLTHYYYCYYCYWCCCYYYYCFYWCCCHLAAGLSARWSSSAQEKKHYFLIVYSSVFHPTPFSHFLLPFLPFPPQYFFMFLFDLTCLNFCMRTVAECFDTFSFSLIRFSLFSTSASRFSFRIFRAIASS